MSETEKINKCEDIEVLKLYCIGLLNYKQKANDYIDKIESYIGELNWLTENDSPLLSNKCSIDYITETLTDLKGEH